MRPTSDVSCVRPPQRLRRPEEEEEEEDSQPGGCRGRSRWVGLGRSLDFALLPFGVNFDIHSLLRHHRSLFCMDADSENSLTVVIRPGLPANHLLV